MNRLLRWLPLAALLAACTSGPSRLDGIAIEKISAVELHPGNNRNLGLDGPPLSVFDHTPARAMIVDLTPPDTLLTLAHEAHFGLIGGLRMGHERGNTAVVGFKACHGAQPFDLLDADGGAMPTSMINGQFVHFTEDRFGPIKAANPGARLRALLALRIVDSAHPLHKGRDFQSLDIEALRASKADLCLRVFYAVVLDTPGPNDKPTTTMQSDVLLIPLADLERVLAAPPLPAP